ncbi:MAG: sigma-70 family RNA polymerase sigma factor [Clostridiaceae bacterium]|nr:sigma-70 family RNA polymerase sigma factor [Clostridiaceae bacterium]
MENRAGKKLNYSTDIEEHLSYLMQRYGKQVYRLAYYYVRDKHLTEDIYQEVFIRVYKNYHKFRHESSFYTWIYRITVNLCKDYLKSAKVRRIITAGFLKDNSTPREFNKLLEEAEGGGIFSAVMELPERYRLPISLYYLDGLPISEISRILKISESNVKVRLHRGRNKLKELLIKEGRV